MQLPAKQLGWVTGPLGSNPSLSASFLVNPSDESQCSFWLE